MKATTESGLWATADWKHLYLIPERTVLTPGLEPIFDLEGNQRLVTLEALAPFACSQDAAKDHLYAGWQASLAATKRAWLDLYNFCQRSGQQLDLEEVGRQFKEGFEMAGDRAQEAFEMGRAFTESVVAAAQSADSRSEAEQKELFKQVFGQLPQLLEQFSEENLERAAEDPDAWAERLHQQVFGESDQRKQDQRRQKLAEDIRASIADRLREAGLTPSIDLKDEREPGEKR